MAKKLFRPEYKANDDFSGPSQHADSNNAIFHLFPSNLGFQMTFRPQVGVWCGHGRGCGCGHGPMTPRLLGATIPR